MTALRPAAALAVAAFGTFDLHLTGSAGQWFWVSNMSALWLLLPFLAGAVQRTALGAVLLGLAVTLAALGTFNPRNRTTCSTRCRVRTPTSSAAW